MGELPPPPPPPMSLAAVASDTARRASSKVVQAWRAASAAQRALWLGAGVVLAVVAAIVWWRVAAGPNTPPEVLLPRAAVATPDRSSGGGKSSGTPTTALVAVHAAGAVVRPGVYRVAADARVSDVVDAAGGALTDADLHAINLAAPVEDGQRVYVPRRGEAPLVGDPPTGDASAQGVVPGTGADGGRVNINTATLAELDALPGIGPATAQAIVDHRREHGRFKSVDELLDVRGIGEARLAAIRNRVRV